MNPHSKSIFSILPFLTLLAMLIGVLPASTVQAESFASPLYASGDFHWAKRVGGTSDDVGYSIAVDSSGNIYTTGSFIGAVDFDPGAGVANLTGGGIFVSKLDNSGNFVWAKSMSNGHGNSIAVDSSGNVYTTGWFEGTADFDPGAGTANLTSTGLSDIFVSKLDSNGDFVWAKNMGGTDYDDSRSIALDPLTGDVYTTGSYKGTADFDPGAGTFNLTSAGNKDIFVSKLDSDGNFVWAKSMGGTGDLDYGYGIAIDPFSNVYTTGYFGGTADFDPGAGTFNLTSAGNKDIFVSKLTGNGNYAWAKRMGGTSIDSGWGVAVDLGGNAYTTGYFGGTADFDPGAGTFNLTSMGGSDIFVSKLDGSGNFVWAKRMGGMNAEYGQGIAVDLGGNVFTTGFFGGTTDFDPGAGTFYLGSAGGDDIFVSKLNGSGNFIWAKRMGGTSNDYGNGIAIDASNNVYTTGYFGGAADFDPGAGIANLVSAGSDDIFLSKLGDTVTSTFRSVGANDGWALESTETSSVGGTLDSTATTFNLGDNAQDKQYRAILSFNTATLPDNAVITRVTLKIRKQGQVGTNPFTILGGLKVDMRKPYFGTAVGLVIHDFQAAAGKSAVATFNATPVSNWYSALLNATGRNYVNKTGTTQFRLYFRTDDNNDNGADYMKFFSGDYATASARPTLIIEYYVP